MFIFPYEKKLTDEGQLVDPRINLEIKTINGFLTMKFLFDSGADVTTLPFSPYAELFKYKKDNKNKITIGGIEGKGIAGFPFILEAKLGIYSFRLRCYFIDSPIEPLLGRLDFWNHFSIYFNNVKRRMEIEPIING